MPMPLLDFGFSKVFLQMDSHILVLGLLGYFHKGHLQKLDLRFSIGFLKWPSPNAGFGLSKGFPQGSLDNSGAPIFLET